MQIVPEVDKGPLRPLGGHCEWRLEQRAWAAVAVEQYLEVPKEKGVGLLATHIGLGTAPGVIGDFSAQFDDLVSYDQCLASLNNKVLHSKQLTPNVGFWHADYCRNRVPLFMDKVKSSIYRINWTTAPVAYRMIHEIVAGMNDKNE